MVRLANWCTRRSYTVLGAWALALVVLGGLVGVLGTHFTDSSEMPNSESATAYSLLARTGDDSATTTESGKIVWQTADGVSVTGPVVRSDIAAMLKTITALPGVESVVSPYTKAGANQLNTATGTAYALVTIDDGTDIDPIVDAANAHDSASVQVELGGTAFTAEPAAGGVTEGLGVIAALLILLLVFRSIWAAVLPILTGVVGVVTSLLAVMLASHVIDLSDSVITMGSLIGLGVGIDYALFIVNRHRKAILAGSDVPGAIATALNTSGRAVIFAGLTVMAALLGMAVIGMSTLTGMAAAAAVTVLFTVLSANTLLPALLKVLGHKVLSRKHRKQIRALEAQGATHPELPTQRQAIVARNGRPGLGSRWAGAVQNHPARAAVAALVVVAALASPALSMRLGNADASSDPAGSDSHAYYETMSRGFGQGADATLLLVATTPDAASAKAFTAMVGSLPSVPNVASAVVTSQADGLSVAAVTPTRSAETEETSDLVTTLREKVIPAAEAGTTMQVHVGGTTATDIDMSNALMDKLPLYLVLVAALGFLLLVVAFRSLLVPLLGALTNLITICVGLGVVTAIFQFGWGSDLLGVGSGAPTQYLVPVMIAGVMFGLSMDYQVFLVSQMHEEWTATRDNRRAVRVGVAETAGVIVAAATIMLCVFSSFGFSGERIVSAIGLGMAISVVVDALVVRLTLMPALMTLLGRATWYYPRPLAAITPKLALESADDVSGASVPQGDDEVVYSYSGTTRTAPEGRFEGDERTWTRR